MLLAMFGAWEGVVRLAYPRPMQCWKDEPMPYLQGRCVCQELHRASHAQPCSQHLKDPAQLALQDTPTLTHGLHVMQQRQTSEREGNTASRCASTQHVAPPESLTHAPPTGLTYQGIHLINNTAGIKAAQYLRNVDAKEIPAYWTCTAEWVGLTPIVSCMPVVIE